MRRGSMLVLVLTMVFSLLAIVPAAAVSTPDTDGKTIEEAEATLASANPFKKQGDGVWIVHLDEAPVATYDGSTRGLDGTSNEVTGEDKLDVDTPESRAYRSHLEAAHAEFISALNTQLDRSVTIRNEYFNAANGVSLWMTWEEANSVAKMDGVSKVAKDTRHTLTTDNGPAWIGAPSAWSGSATGVPTKGEGVIVGVLDTGINPANPSFADVGPIDGYDHTNPNGSGVYFGECSTDPTLCNDKLIGIWSLVPGSPFGGIDDDGHGSHTASTAAGNEVVATVTGPSGISEDRTISGVAPHANIIAYDVCDGEGCNGTAILAGIEQAIADGVDVINYSIGSEDPSDPWSSGDDIGFLAARAAGIFVAHSAGNEGPGYETVGSPMAPWITHVAATTHDRAYLNGLINMSGGDTAPPADIVGLGFTTATAADMDIVYAGDYPATVAGGTANLCGAGGQLDFISPWAPDTFNSNQIVVCDRGTYGRVEKGANVLAAGAGGMVLADNGGGLSGDAHDLPAVHISQTDGDVLKTWLASGSDHKATIQGATLSVDASHADVMAGFSSRGPNRSADFIAPSVAAPGVDIIAAHGTGNEVKWDFVSGTSMASPHVAGVGALMKVLQPSWSPAEVESALMMTGVRDLVKEDGATPADPFDLGGGRVDVAAAANAGLVLKESVGDYEAADPAAGGDPTSLNLASMSDRACVVECSWTRELTATTAGTWNLATTTSGGMTLAVSPSTITLAAGQTATVTVTANVTGAAANRYHFGSVEITGTGPDLHLPIAVQPTTGSIPEIVKITTARDTGSIQADGFESLEITDLRVDIVGLTKADLSQHTLVEDPTSLEVYDDLSQVLVTTIDVPAGSLELIAEVTQSDAPDLDLYLGFDTNGDGIPQEGEQICQSASGTALESCSVEATPGQYWLIIQNWAQPATGLEHGFTVATAIVPDTDLGNMEVTGPDTQPQLEPFSVGVQWDLDATAGDRFYGAFSLGTSSSNPGNIGTVPVRLARVADDVTKTVSASEAVPGDTLEYTITVNPNVTPQDLAYTITDTIPDGMTYVDGSVTGGATVADGVVEWSGVMESPSLAEMFYEVSTPSTNPACDTGFGGYVDLAAFGILPQSSIVGDTSLFTTATSNNPIPFYGDYYNGVSFTDDGFIIFDAPNNYAGAPWTAQETPDADYPNNVLALLWNDFEIFYDDSNPADIGGVSLATAGPDVAIIEYDQVQYFGGSPAVLDMEVVLFSVIDPVFPEIVVAYANVDPAIVAALPTPSSIGVENAAGDAGLSVAFGDPQAVLDEGMVCYDWVGPEFDPVVITYQVTVDGDAPHGVASNQAVHVTDNPGDMAATAVADVAITNLAGISGDARDVLNTVNDVVGDLLENRDEDERWQDVAKLWAAQYYLNQATHSWLWRDDATLGGLGSLALWYMERAADALEDIHKSAGFDEDAEALAQAIAKAAQGLASDAIDDSSTHPSLIERAEKALAKGDKDLAKGDAAKAVRDYREAWILANTWWGWGGGHGRR